MPVSAFHGRSLPMGDYYLIVAERRTRDGHRVAEAFLLIPRARTSYNPVSFRFSWGALEPDPALVADVDLLEAARQWALVLIDEEVVFSVQNRQPSLAVPDLPMLETCDAERLISLLHIRRLLVDELVRMQNETRNDELRALLQAARRLPRLWMGRIDE